MNMICQQRRIISVVQIIWDHLGLFAFISFVCFFRVFFLLFAGNSTFRVMMAFMGMAYIRVNEPKVTQIFLPSVSSVSSSSSPSFSLLFFSTPQWTLLRSADSSDNNDNVPSRWKETRSCQNYSQLWRSAAPKQIKLLTPDWSHFKGLFQLSKMRPS